MVIMQVEGFRLQPYSSQVFLKAQVTNTLKDMEKNGVVDFIPVKDDENKVLVLNKLNREVVFDVIVVAEQKNAKSK